MNRMASIQVSFRIPFSGLPQVDVAKEIDGPFLLQFEPIRFESSAMMAALNRGTTSKMIPVVAKRRKRYADILARELSNEIVKHMERLDTLDGYRIVSEDRTNDL